MRRDLGTIEAARAMLVAEMSSLMGSPIDEVAFSDLIAHAPENLRQELENLQAKLRASAVEISALGTEATQAAGARLQRISGAQQQLEAGAVETTGGYSRWGTGQMTVSPSPIRVDENA